MKITKNNNPWRPNEFSPQDPKEWKIFPRNLTARAAYILEFGLKAQAQKKVLRESEIKK